MGEVCLLCIIILAINYAQAFRGAVWEIVQQSPGGERQSGYVDRKEDIVA